MALPASSDDGLLDRLRTANARSDVPDEARLANERFLTRAAAGGPLVFFRPAPTGGWVYGVARSAPDLYDLREKLVAFLGTTHAIVPPSAHSPDSADAFESALPADRVVRFTVPAASVRPAAEALVRMASLADRAPTAGTDRAPEAGSLRAFYLNLRAGDRPGAERELRRLESAPEWTEDNLLGLRVELLAAFGAWREMLGLRELPQLTAARRTPATTRAVLRAFHEERLARHEGAGRFDLALGVFRADVRPTVERLLSVRTGLDDPASCRLLAYRAAADRDEVARATLLAEAAGEERAVLEAIFAAAPAPAAPTPAAPTPAAPTPPPLPDDPVAAAHARYDEGDVDGAYRLAADAPPGLARAELLFDCADEIGTLDACHLALGAYRELVPLDRDRIDRKPRLRRLRQKLEASVAAKPEAPVEVPPGNWPELLERLDDPGNLDLVAVARRAADEWPVERLTRAEVDRIVAALYRADTGDRRRLLLDLLPHLLGGVQRAQPGASAALHPLRVAVFELLLLTHDYQPAGLTLVLDTAESLLAGGLTADEYRQLVSQLIEVWTGDPSKGLLPWLLEVVELLADYPSPARDERRRVLGLFAGISPVLLRELSATDWDVLGQVAGQLDLGDEVAAARAALPAARSAAGPVVPAADPFASLAGRTVGIYTLHEPAAKRAGEIIRRKCPGCEVETNDNKVRTPALEGMASRCDVVVVVIRAGKHMATEAIEDIRRRLDRPTVRAIGQSTSSIVRELERFLSDGGLS